MLRLRRFAFDEPTQVTRRIRELRPTLTSRSIIVLLSDLHEPGAVHSAALLAQQHEVAVVQLQDPAEAIACWPVVDSCVRRRPSPGAASSPAVAAR